MSCLAKTLTEWWFYNSLPVAVYILHLLSFTLHFIFSGPYVNFLFRQVLFHEGIRRTVLLIIMLTDSVLNHITLRKYAVDSHVSRHLTG